MGRNPLTDWYATSYENLEKNIWILANEYNRQLVIPAIEFSEEYWWLTHCIKKIMLRDPWEGEQITTVGDNEPDTNIDDDYPSSTLDDPWPTYEEIRRKCFEELRRRGDGPDPPWWPKGDGFDDVDDDSPCGPLLLVLTDDFVNQGWAQDSPEKNWYRLRDLLLRMIRRCQDTLIHIKFVGSLHSMVELGLVQPKWNGPTARLRRFVEDVNVRDPRILFELNIHSDSTGTPKHPDLYLYGRP